MGKLTGTRYGDAANNLMVFYQEKSRELEKSGEYFMAAVALAFALETAILAYLLVEFDEENGGELEVSPSVDLFKLIEEADALGVLNAPISIPSHVSDDEDADPPKHIAKDAADKIRRFRRVIHPARALERPFDPRTFTQGELKELQDMYESVLHSLLYNI